MRNLPQHARQPAANQLPPLSALGWFLSVQVGAGRADDRPGRNAPVREIDRLPEKRDRLRAFVEHALTRMRLALSGRSGPAGNAVTAVPDIGDISGV